jgi:ketosteroid isomerase-like protein
MPPDLAEEHRHALERFYAAFNARDEPRILDEIHPEIEFESRFAQAGGTTYRGREGVRGWLADLGHAWEYIDVELHETVERDGRTIALITLHGKGRASGIELHEPTVHELSWRDGKLASLRYTEREDAGLSQD